MATVRMSEGLKSIIQSNIEKMFDKRLQSERVDAEKKLSIFGERIRRIVVPDEIIEIINRPKMNMYLGQWNLTNNISVSFSLRNRFNTTISFLYNYKMPSWAGGYSGSAQRVDLTPQKNIELYKEFDTIYNDYLNLIEEKNIVVKGVIDQINNVATLKQLIEVWPMALDFVDEETKKRYFEKKEYTRKTPVATFDEAVKSGLLKARIGNEL